MENDEFYTNEAAKLELTNDGKVCISVDQYCSLIEDQTALGEAYYFFGKARYEDFEDYCQGERKLPVATKDLKVAINARIKDQANSSPTVPAFWSPIKGYELKELQQYLVLSFGVPQVARCVLGELFGRDANGNHFKYDKNENGEYANISSIALIPHMEQSNA